MDDGDFDITPQSVHQFYAKHGLEASEISEKLDIALSDVHFLLGTYHRIQTEINDHDQERREQVNADTIPPNQDIDVAHDVDTLRIERMSEDTVWLAGYSDSDDDPDYAYWFKCEESGLSASHETWVKND